MKHWSIKTTDSDDLPIRLHIEAETQEGAIAAVREKGYFPEGVKEIVPIKEPKQISKTRFMLYAVIIAAQIGVLFYTLLNRV